MPGVWAVTANATTVEPSKCTGPRPTVQCPATRACPTCATARTCTAPGLVLDDSKAATVCGDKCNAEQCCKPLRCFNSGNNGNAHVCTTPAWRQGADLFNVVYDATKDESLCPKSGCTDKLCCRKVVSKWVSAEYEATDAGHAAAVGAACATVPAVTALAILA